MFEELNPEEYVKLMNLRECLFTCFYEIEERELMEQDGFHSIGMIYLDNQFYYLKKDIGNYDFSDEKLNKTVGLVKKRCEGYLKWSKSCMRDFSKLSWKRLMKLYWDFRKKWGATIRIIDIPVYCSYHFESKVAKLMQKHGFSEADFDALAHPLYKTFHQRRQRDLYLLKEGKLSRQEFKKRWEWSQMMVFFFNPVDDKFIDEQLRMIKDPAKELRQLDDLLLGLKSQVSGQQAKP